MKNFLLTSFTILFIVDILPVHAHSNDPDTLMSKEYRSYKEVAYLSDYFEIDRLIPLELPSGKEFTIFKMQMVEDKIYVRTMNENNSLFIYDLAGNLKRHVNLMEFDPNPFIQVPNPRACPISGISDFDVYNGEISILDNIRNRIISYDLQGNYLYAIDLPMEHKYSCFSKLDSGHYLVQLNPPVGEIDYALAEIDGKGNIVKRFLPDTAPHFEYNLAQSHVFFRTRSGAIRFIPSYGNMIYSYQEAKVIPFIQAESKYPVATPMQLLKYTHDYGAPQLNAMWCLSYYAETKSLIRFHYFVSNHNSVQVNYQLKEDKWTQVNQLFFEDDLFNQMMDSRAIYSKGTMSVHAIDHWNENTFFNLQLVQDYPWTEDAKKRISKLDYDTFSSLLVVLKEK